MIALLERVSDVEYIMQRHSAASRLFISKWKFAVSFISKGIIHVTRCEVGIKYFLRYPAACGGVIYSRSIVIHCLYNFLRMTL